MSKYEIQNSTIQLNSLDFYLYKNVSKDDFGFNYIYPTDLKKLIPDTEVINYVSVLPGVGKTHWARKKMVEGSINKDYIYLYVAPTKLLLKEVYKDLKKTLKKKNRKATCEIFYNSTEDFSSDSFTLTDRFLDTLNLAKKGDIFLITHALYLGMPELENKSKIFAIFDEAQQIGVKPCDIVLDQKDLAYFRDNTYLELLASNDRPKNISGNIDSSYIEKYFKIQGKPTVVTQYKKRSKDQFNKDFYKLLQNSINPKVGVYIMPKGKQMSFFSFTSPKHSFKGFAKIYLMGAFFEVCELYHLLRKEGHILRDVSTKVNLNRQAIVRERFMSLSILPILKVDKHLSKHMLNKQLIIDKNTNLEILTKDFSKTTIAIKELLKKEKNQNPKYKYTKASSILKHVFQGNSYTKKIDNVIEPLVKKYAKKLHNTFDYLLDSCLNKLSYDKKPLLIVNVAKKDFKHNKEDFEVLTPNIHGLNKYKENHSLVFLAALNAPPTLSLFYSHFIPKFSQEEHWIASNIVQAVCRLNLRDVKSNEPSFLIVPTSKTAKLVRAILNPYLIVETIECHDPIMKVNFLDFADTIKIASDYAKTTKNYLVEKSKGNLLESKLTTEQLFCKFPEYKKLTNAYTKLSMTIKRSSDNLSSEELKKLLDEKIYLANEKALLKAKIAKREGFTEYQSKTRTK